MDETDIFQQIEEYASLFLTVDEICILCDLDPAEFRREIRGKRTDKAKAYLKGKIKSMLEIRRLTVEFAKKGSPQAETLVNDYIEKMESNE